MPAQEIDISAALVRELLVAQFPDLADQPLSLLANGWDNVIYRLGETLLVRLPRRAVAAELVLNEQRCLAELALRLPVAVPVAVGHGRPSAAFPWPWSIMPWFAGVDAGRAEIANRAQLAKDLAAFLRALHQTAPADAPLNPYRGVPISERLATTQERVEQLRGRYDVDGLVAIVDEGLRQASFAGPAVWLHGDLHPANLVIDNGRLQAVIDFGDVTAGDPATDLAIGWMLFDANHRQLFRSHLGAYVDDALWIRARAWAAILALAIAANSADNPPMLAIAERTILNLRDLTQ